MNQKKFDELKEKVQAALSKVHIAGIKGEDANKFLRSMAMRLQSKGASYKSPKQLEGYLAHLHEDIEKHLIRKAENHIEHSFAIIIADCTRLYHLLHSSALFEKHDLLEVETLAEDIEQMKKKGRISDDNAKKIKAAFKNVLDKWKNTLEKHRENLNATYARRVGRAGFSNVLGDAFVKEGYFKYRKERGLIRHAVKDEKGVERLEQYVGKGKSFKNKKGLDDFIKSLVDLEGQITNEFTQFDRMVFATWDHLNEELSKLIIEVSKAAGAHELPALTEKQSKELKALIIDRIEETYLHNIRIIIAQEEGYFKQAQAAVRKAA
ncbi:hypothetical protein HOK51_04005 [Candidatus Woesearchaeota archaeon]|jgi:ElaB/YqjD/DUF883 family membrane-anchored ribosome-binding protein|nr:hypothetical protein [Candidatus Woesearchaeota archaeon]MBT6518985.1 hypothetical protein [Candidatus Woesearchaeota archaeon]MBT7368350.1 hypothetical protein [Candidatus Woesearchaeota archaeon]